MWVLALAAGACILISSALAVDPAFKMGEPVFFGSGCPNNTVQITASNDSQSVAVLFSAFTAVTTSDVNRDRKSCSLIVPVKVLPGVSIGVFQVDYRGHAFVPPVARAYTEFQANYFFAGATGPTYKRTWNANSNEELLATNKLGVSAIVWSPCGLSTNFRINAALMAYKPKLSDADPQIAIDTTNIAVERGFRFYITFKPCVSPPTKNP